MRVQSLGQEVPLEKKVATHSGILAWKFPWTEEPGGATVHGVPKGLTQLSTHTGIHTPMGLEYSMNLSYRWGSSDLKNQMYFTLSFSICQSVVPFFLLMENETMKFILEFDIRHM